ncbi:MAG: 16S rRNA (guanine(966)-N(2))-methyltransferase RsmD [Oscillospiraceae bacterium]|jgi:16S rRNA (guanine(966)-N(2))-methyltransferase RsmD|nr:16S rRNA (guanine(966)-N(2))-methyltransferase RsmD [Oscillospiraceae bacterium]
MRVITGRARGRNLRTVPGDTVRPTSQRVKEAIFSVIQFDIEGRRVLDLFSGSGQLGIEALSRGARAAVFVDSSRASLTVTQENLRHTGLHAAAVLVPADALGYLSTRPEPFDIVFLDPPYNARLLPKALDAIVLFDIVNPGGIIICEADRSFEPPALPVPYRCGRTYRYGAKAVTLYQKEMPGGVFV